MEQLQNEINALDSRFKVVRKQIEFPNTEQDIKNQMIEFLKVSILTINIILKRQMTINIHKLKIKNLIGC